MSSSACLFLAAAAAAAADVAPASPLSTTREPPVCFLLPQPAGGTTVRNPLFFCGTVRRRCEGKGEGDKTGEPQQEGEVCGVAQNDALREHRDGNARKTLRDERHQQHG